MTTTMKKLLSVLAGLLLACNSPYGEDNPYYEDREVYEWELWCKGHCDWSEYHKDHWQPINHVPECRWDSIRIKRVGR